MHPQFLIQNLPMDAGKVNQDVNTGTKIMEKQNQQQ